MKKRAVFLSFFLAVSLSGCGMFGQLRDKPAERVTVDGTDGVVIEIREGRATIEIYPEDADGRTRMVLLFGD